MKWFWVVLNCNTKLGKMLHCYKTDVATVPNTYCENSTESLHLMPSNKEN
jgi:hypothetical protein